MHLVGNNLKWNGYCKCRWNGYSIGKMIITFKYNWSIRHNWLIIFGGVKVHKLAAKVHNLNSALT